MDLPIHLAFKYHNASQVARVTSEAWTGENLRCPRCAGLLLICAANTRTKDFDCCDCREPFQLKSCTKKLDGKFVGAEYSTTMRSIASGQHPSLILLRYSKTTMSVLDVDYVHRSCITSQCITPRKPLTALARRAGWQGCVLDVNAVPRAGRVNAVRSGEFVPQVTIESAWHIADRIMQVPARARSWLAIVLSIVESLPPEFVLSDVYASAGRIEAIYPNNRHVNAKIRQQLQVLRDLGILTFAEQRGHYRRTL
jgi:type II restriction enzyme